MKEIIVRLARMIRLLHAKGRRVASIKPFGRDIFLLEIQVAGTHYIENMNDIEPSLHVGSRLDFFVNQLIRMIVMPLLFNRPQAIRLAISLGEII